MFSVRGIFQNGEIILSEKVAFNEPMKVIVTFLDELQEQTDTKIRRFSFNQSRKLLNNIPGSLLGDEDLKQELR